MRVLETIPVRENQFLLVCPLFPDQLITETLSTNCGEVGSGDFIVYQPSECFGTPSSRDVLVRNIKNADKIKEIHFV